MQKAPSFASEDEDDKTTIESGWEEEASTTVEQGEVAEKIRSLALGEPKRRSGTNITSTDGGSMSDEPTVDEARANIALAALPPPVLARLVITGGNDAGQELEVLPGKTYTIGRGMDNDLVLTDIAVSRKHFDVRHDNGAWVLADRGSGNGTLVNTRIEDAPFMLASGDVIEIGNTAFRFDVPNGAPRAPLATLRDPETPVAFQPPAPNAPIVPELADLPDARGVPDVDDDLEMSTVSGKPYRELESTTPPEPAATARPKPPPPILPRPRSPTSRPSGYPVERPRPLSQALPAPLPQPPAPSALAAAPPIISAPGPHTLHLPQPSSTMPLPQMANRTPLAMGPSGLVDPGAGPMPPTLPGGQAAPLPVRLARLPFASYAPASSGPPGTAEIPTQRSPNGARPPLQVTASQPGRDATLTAQVLPMGYSGAQAAALPTPPVYGPALPISRQAKMVLAGIGIAVFAAVATIAIIKGARGSASPPAPSVTEPAAVKPTRATVVTPAKAVVTPIPAAPAPTRTDKPATTTTTTTATAPVRIAVAPPAPVATAPTPAPIPAPRIAPAPAPAPQIAPPTPTPTAPAPAPVAPPRVETADPRPDKKLAPARPDKKPAEKKTMVATIDVDRPEPARTEKKRGRGTQDVKSEANTLYRNKNFTGAVNAISAALPNFSGSDLQDLRSLAAIYLQLGKAYSVGMAPGTKPTEAFLALRRATSYDRDVGGAYVAELQERLITVASRAAVSYMAAKEYESAFQAVRTSESLGSTSSSNKAVRDKLEASAADLYRAAQGELTSDPEGAKKKLRQILGMVEPKHPIYAKAQKLLGAP